MKRDWFDDWLAPKSEDAKAEASTLKETTTTTLNPKTDDDELQADHTEPYESDTFDEDDNDDETNEIDGSGLHKTDDTNEVFDLKVDRFCEYYYQMSS